MSEGDDIMPTEEQIKKQLTECYKKNRQPVLLYGKDDYERKKLVEEVHSKNVGIDTPPTEWEYQGDDESTKRIDSMRGINRKSNEKIEVSIL